MNREAKLKALAQAQGFCCSIHDGSYDETPGVLLEAPPGRRFWIDKKHDTFIEREDSWSATFGEAISVVYDTEPCSCAQCQAALMSAATERAREISNQPTKQNLNANQLAEQPSTNNQEIIQAPTT